MGYFKYKYHCLSCNQDKYSYINDIPTCVFCGSSEITVEDVRHLNIEKFSDEGRKLIKKEDDMYIKKMEGK